MKAIEEYLDGFLDFLGLEKEEFNKNKNEKKTHFF